MDTNYGRRQKTENITNRSSRKPAITTGRNLEMFPESVSEVDRALIRNAVRFYAHHVFSVGPSVSRLYFKEYYILYWSGDWIIESSKDKQGILRRNGKDYEIVFKHPTTRGMIMRNPDKQFALSFREPFADYQVNPVVIISANNRRDI